MTVFRITTDLHSHDSDSDFERSTRWWETDCRCQSNLKATECENVRPLDFRMEVESRDHASELASKSEISLTVNWWIDRRTAYLIYAYPYLHYRMHTCCLQEPNSPWSIGIQNSKTLKNYSIHSQRAAAFSRTQKRESNPICIDLPTRGK